MIDPLSPIFHIQLGSLLTIIVTGGLGIFSLVRGWNQNTTRLFGIYSLFICGWCFFYYQMSVTDDAEWALFSGRFLHYFAPFIPATFLHFVQHLTGVNNHRRQIWLRRFLYGAGLFFLAIAFHPSFVPSVSSIQGFKYYIDWGPLYFPFYAVFNGSFVYVIYLLIHSCLKASGQKRVQLSYTVLAYGIGFAGSCTVFFPHFNLPTPKPALYLIVVTHVIIVYAIVRHQLLNLKILIRRAGLLMLIYGFLVAMAIPILILFHKHVLGLDTSLIRVLMTEAVIMGGVLPLGPFLYAVFLRKSLFFHEHTVAGLTHELKSPLAAIESALQVLTELKTEKSLSTKQMEYIEMIDRNSNRLRNYVNDLLQVMKKRDENIPLEMEKVNVGDLCKKVSVPFREMAQGRGLSFNLTIDTRDLFLVCDRQKIEQVISNVLSNALKFTETGGIDLNVREDSDRISFTVADTGPGVPPNELPHIFERFYQGRRGKERKGTGIGLAIAKTWVEAHGGEIHAESQGNGLIVTFAVPA